MDPTIPTPTVSSTVTTSSISMQAPPPSPLQLLEISLISAQDLTPVSKSMRTYAVAWVNPSRKLTTRTDQHGHTHPTWNEKLTFRVDNQFLLSDDAAITVEIYTISWFREVLVGTVRVLISDLLAPPSGSPLQNHPRSIRFVALQVRRPSGTPQGILNMGVALLDSSMRSMPLRSNPAKSPTGDDFLHAVEKKMNALGIEHQEDGDQRDKAHLWRSLSLGSEVNDEFPSKTGSIYNPGSVVNGSTCNGSSVVNGSELCSDIGPSASIVAAELAKKCQPPTLPPPKRPIRYEDTGSSILEELTVEEAKAKGYRIRTNRERWRSKQVPSGKQDYDTDDQSDLSSNCNRHSRRNSDGGLFSCFGNAYGIEFTIVCGASNHPSSKRPSNSASRRNMKPSEANSA